MNLHTKGDYGIRIELSAGGNDTHFIDVQELDKMTASYNLKAIAYEHFSYIIIARSEEVGGMIEMYIFPNKEWYDDWKRENKEKLNVIWEGGKVKEVSGE